MQATPPPDTPPMMGRRLGPRPLLLHLALATLRSSSSAPAWPSSNADWQKLLAQIAQSGPDPESPIGPDAELIHGIACYRRHPYARNLPDPPLLWQEGETRLLDFGDAASAPPPLLLIPSLVNRATILDLAPGRSMARALAQQGLRVLLLDWGWPDAATRPLDLNALITGRLARAIEAAATATAARPILAGYCMGGLLAMAAARLLPHRVSGLALLATPWDFHAGRTETERGMARLLEAVEPMMQITGTLPVDALQLLFSVGDPQAVGDKYRAFGRTDQTSDRARQFVAIEDWLNDGVPLAAPIARDCLGLWYGANAPAGGTWRIGGEAIIPQAMKLPVFAAIPGRDRIVPPESAMPLASAFPDAVVVRPEAGHVGMVAGATAATALWSPLAAWARNLAAPRPGQGPGFRSPKRTRKLRA